MRLATPAGSVCSTCTPPPRSYSLATNRCEEGQHNDLATLFLSSSHHTIVSLFSMGHNPGEPYVVHFTQGSLALFVIAYLVLMSVGAGVAIPGGLFMPSIMVGGACRACCRPRCTPVCIARVRGACLHRRQLQRWTR